VAVLKVGEDNYLVCHDDWFLGEVEDRTSAAVKFAWFLMEEEDRFLV